MKFIDFFAGIGGFPKYLFAENVAGLLSHDGGKTFGVIIATLGELGYEWQYQILNSKDFGVPQNRERVFIVGHLRGERRPEVFPVVGTNSKAIKQIIGGSQGYRVYDSGGLSVTLASQAGGMGAKTGLYMVMQKTHGDTTTVKFNETGTLQAARLDKIPCIMPVLTPNREEKRQNGRRFKMPGEPMFTLTAQDRHGIYDGIRIRKLTPLECFRLQGFPDNHYYNAKKAGISDSQLYKQAGNSVTTKVVYEVAIRLTA